MSKKPITFKELTVGSYIKKRLTKGFDMLCVDSITPDSCKVRIWSGGSPVKQTFTLKKNQVDGGDYVFIMKVQQQKML